MKAILVLMTMMLGGSLSAQAMQIDPNLGEGVYQSEIDGSIIYVMETIPSEVCSAATPAGVNCNCSRYMIAQREIPNWTPFHGYWLRPGWNVYGNRSTHVCRKG